MSLRFQSSQLKTRIKLAVKTKGVKNGIDLNRATDFFFFLRFYGSCSVQRLMNKDPGQSHPPYMRLFE